MNEWINIVVLGIIEGVTEFLPISSTGHLLLAQHWLNPRQSDLFNVVIQSGAVIAVALIFTDRLKQILFRLHEPAARDYLSKLAAAFALTAAGGLALKFMEFRLTDDTANVAWATLIGGVLFLLIERFVASRPKSERITWGIALALGAAQLAAALFPGLSRSGATILVGLALGLDRRAAVEFSFLLGVPTLIAAGGLQLASHWADPAASPERWDHVLAATVIASVTAFVSVRWLLRFLQNHTFEVFGWYRIALGAGILLLVA